MEETSSPGTTPGNSDPELNLKHYWEMVRRQVWLIGACVLIVFALSAVYAFKATPIYSASARLDLERRMPQSGQIGNAPDDYYTSEAAFQTQIKLITSENVLSRALQARDLDRLVRSQAALPQLWGGLVSAIWREASDAFSSAPPRPTAAWEYLAGMVEIRSVRDTNLVDVVVSGSNPYEAARIANAIANAYVAYSISSRQQGAVAMLTKLQQVKEEQAKTVATAEAALQAYREGMISFSIDEAAAAEKERPLYEEMGQVKLDRVRLATATATIRSVEEAAPETADFGQALANPLVIADPQVKEFSARLANAEADLVEARKTLGEKNPETIVRMTQIGTLRGLLRDAIVRFGKGIPAQYPLLDQRESAVQKILAVENQTVANKALEYEHHKRAVDRETQVYNMIVDKMKEADFVRDLGVTNVSLAGSASVPLTPERPNRRRILMVGAFLGLLLGLGLAYGVEYLTDTVTSADDMEKRLGLQPLGSVPRLPARDSDEAEIGLNERSTYYLRYPFSPAADAFRTIRTNVCFRGWRGDIRALMVTSALPGEGKTLVANNLAACFTQEGKRVLLVDTDLRHAMVHVGLALEPSPGLSDLLAHGMKLEEVIQSPKLADSSPMKNLHVIAAGTPCPNPAELLGSEEMTRFMEMVREKYDFVIYDSCPTMLLADVAQVASRCDGIVVVVRFNASRTDRTARVMRQLTTIKGKIIGGVLNGLHPRGLDGNIINRYGYGYRYRHGYGMRRGVH